MSPRIWDFQRLLSRLLVFPTKVCLSQIPTVKQSTPVPPQFTAAKADIVGNGITGTIWMGQNPVLIGINGYLQGNPTILTPGLQGLHIHQKGSCQPPDFSTAGGYFDPGTLGNSTVANHPYHMGDLPNIQINATGRGGLGTVSTRFTLSPGPLSLFDLDGSAIVVTALPDQKKPNGTAAAEAGGNRIACGVIQGVQYPTPSQN